MAFFKELVVILLSLAVSVRAAEKILECYTCVSTAADNSCYLDPDNSGIDPTTECQLGENQCCYIQRRDDNDDIGTPIDFSRGCSSDCDPDRLGTMVETPDFTATTYQTFCDTTKCNTGPGNISPGTDGGNKDSILGIKGYNSAPSRGGGRPAAVIATGTIAALAGNRIVHEGL